MATTSHCQEELYGDCVPLAGGTVQLPPLRGGGLGWGHLGDTADYLLRKP